MLRRFALGALVFVCVLVPGMAGCTGSESATETATSTEAPTTTAAESTTETASSTDAAASAAAKRCLARGGTVVTVATDLLGCKGGTDSGVVQRYYSEVWPAPGGSPMVPGSTTVPDYWAPTAPTAPQSCTDPVSAAPDSSVGGSATQSGTGWRVVASPAVEDAELVAVAARTPDDVWAVGSRGLEADVSPLIEHWDGKRWAVVSSPCVVGRLLDVAVVSKRDVWAVGEGGGALIEHWDGRKWSRVASPFDGGLRAVAVVSAKDAWAVGDGVIAHWNGKRWTSAGIQPPGLEDVVAVSADDVWAVGGPDVFAMHWDGTRWQPSGKPPGLDFDVLESVTATAANDVWAVGYLEYASPEFTEPNPVPVLVHWDGTAWKEQKPPPRDSDNYLVGTLARSSRELWVLGYDWDWFGYGAGGAFVAVRGVGAWDTSELPPTQLLQAITADPTGALWAVGYTGSGDDPGSGFPAHTTPLVRHYGR